MDKEKIVDIFKETEALLSGHFILTSGKHSPSYFQCAKVLQYPKYLTLFASMIADNFISTKIDAVISPAIGGIVLGTEVGRLLNTKTIFAERKNGAMCIRRGFNIKKNQNILVVEDVITTGGSVKEVMNEVTKLGGLIFGVAILVDRSNGTINLHKNQYSIVELEVVNYDADSVPNNLKEIPVQKPGSRKTQ
ncbi:orotate phosphoribosyltransferase [bacterium]|jgi:orotate phosphoribosyltransferase|nr:orotate phosphoribosyltransferase [bacterium]MBT4250166.1 orotate phosphoribosyltransferase [bacterium]MBT4927327.1 orotate phosphoribosyltransferase [bacterium]MBT5734549.1 orotate phosphoribosyltransferase [bacterium]MBT6018037.1 orotate phosphoribosyltransferase [bacterium]